MPGGVLIEQDQFISDAALDELARSLARAESDTREPEPVALGYQTEGLDATWSASRKLELTWCLGRVFPQPLNDDLAIEHEANVDRIVRNVEAATRAWERLYPEMGACRNGECTPKLDDCFTRDEFDTCEQACAARGSTCAENACEGGTSMVTSTLEVCEDRNLEGVIRPHACDAPIDWQVAGTGRCCCEQE